MWFCLCFCCIQLQQRIFRGGKKFVRKTKASVLISNTAHCIFFNQVFVAAFKSLYHLEGINLIFFQSIDPTTSFQCSCPRAVSFVYITVSVTHSPYRLWHYDRRLHNVHQCFNVYSKLSTNQPSNYI